MAGDWIKMRTDLPEDPAVYRLSRITGLDRLSVVGRLYCFWTWADRHAVDGRVDGAVSTDLDDVVDFDGFADAMAQVKWLEIGEDYLAIPKHDRHNGESAKERSLKNARQARWRGGKDGPVDDSASTPPPTPPSTREEKRREEKREETGDTRKRAPTLTRPDDVSEQTWTDWQQLRKTKRAPVTQTVLNDARSEAGKAGMPLERFLCIWCARGSQGLQADWLRADERRTPASQSAADRRAGTIAGLTNPGAAHGRDHRTVDVDATVVG